MTNGDKSEKEISREFYEIFHQTRLMLIRAFQEKKDVGEQEALYYAQRFMHRAIFLFFALDNGLINNQKLFSDTIFERLKKQECTVESKDIWNDINHLFKALDQGDQQLDIHGFGGDLFSPPLPKKIYFLDFQTKVFFANEIMISKIRKEPELEGEDLETWNEYGDKVSPIIKNLLIMDSYNFKSTLNVTILGHILEQSLDDLNEFQKTGEVKRKIDGVFYTPETLTDHICKNTIIQHLSKNNASTVPELILEYMDDLEELQKLVSQIKIIDPACGSGAFLISAAQILHEISESIQMKKGKSQASSGTLDTWQKEIETSKIIENNIFGADINRDSVEITKLSLFLIMAKPGEKLTNLSQNIIHGNSLIRDKEIDPIGFDWKNKFSEIMDRGGFNVVIGNPPWQIIKPDIDEFFSPLKEMQLMLATNFPTKNKPFSRLDKPTKNKFVKKCLENPNVVSLFNKYNEAYEKQLIYFSNNNSYKLQGKGDVNCYKLFLEKIYSILDEGGAFGLVLPSSVYTDLGAKDLRELLFKKCHISQLCGFTNTKPIFAGVDSRYKFCTILGTKGGTTTKFLSRFMVRDDNELSDFQTHAFEYDLELVKLSSPSYFTIIECEKKIENQIFEKLFQFPVLEDGNVWNFKPSRELDMTNDSHLFHTTNVGPTLYQGYMIHMFTHTFANPTYWLKKEEVEERMKRKNKKDLSIIKKLNLNIPLKIHSQEYRLVWRSVANPTDERTLISTVLPPNVYFGNSLGYLTPLIIEKTKYVKPISNVETLFLTGMLNSFVQDFVMRHKVSRNINYFHINGQPIPRFEQYNMLHKKIFKNSSMLICTTDEYAKLREEVGISEYVTEPEKRMVLEAQINAAAAKIYDLTKEEFEYILESFPSADKDLKEMAMREFLLL
ncbi:MAG: N-6 DNA methylase [Candidatus Nitrosopelagicus sp.]|nr:N-6 DNA methylase [Candidatus Nitrosopelagicus sp.]